MNDIILLEQLLEEVRSQEPFKKGLSNIWGQPRKVVISIYQSNVINAHAFVHRGKMQVSLTSACLRQLSREQLKAIICHECAHHIYKDYRSKFIIPLLFVLMLCLIIIALTKFSFYFLFLLPLNLPLYFLLEGAIKQSQELRADRIAAKIVDPKIVASLFYADKQTNKFFLLFSSHPSNESRITSLLKK